MSLVTNEFQQFTIGDSFISLNERNKNIILKSWAKPFADIILPDINEVRSVLYIQNAASSPSHQWARQHVNMNTEEYRELSRKRNSVEGLPSILRQKYNVNHIPVRGKLSSKLFFGFKIAAINVNKL